jgi:hypothetical protein
MSIPFTSNFTLHFLFFLTFYAVAFYRPGVLPAITLFPASAKIVPWPS